MRVLFLANAASIHTVRWVNSLAKRGLEVHLVFKKDDKPNKNEISSQVFQHKLKYSGTKSYYLNALQLRKLYNRLNPDIVNAHYASGYGTLARIAKVSPLVLSVWGSDVYEFPFQSNLKRKLVQKNLLYATKIASTSHCMADQVKKVLNKSSVEIDVTPFGVDIERFTRKLEKGEKEKIYIGNIKTLESNYAISDLIKAFSILRENLNNRNLKEITDKLVLYIYGDGSQKEELENLIKELNLTNVVELKGKIAYSEVPRALEELDIFCITSLNESFGVAIVEAMAMELPVVATDADGFKEVVDNENTGIIIKKGRPSEIAFALEQLVLNENLRKRMGKKGRERVLKLYNWEKNVDTMIEVYKRTIGKFNY